MIEYSKTAADNKSRIRDLTWMNGRFFAILALCVMPVSAYHLMIGVFGNVHAAMQLGIQTLTLAAVLVAIYVIIYTKTRKAVIGNFEEYEIEGEIKFTIEKIDETTLEFTRLTDEVSFQVTKYDIKRIKRLKSTIVIILENKTTIDLPKRADIDALISF